MVVTAACDRRVKRLQLTVDCQDPQLLVAFWCSALGYVVEPPPDGFDTWNNYWRSRGIPDDELPVDVDASDSIVDPAGVGPRIWFQVVPETKAMKNRLHLDVIVAGRELPLDERRRLVDAEVARLSALGAAAMRTNAAEGVEHYGVVMQDPEGNEFCVA
jgi:hypothetical protein